MTTIQHGSSLREFPVEVTLQNARRFGSARGITRVTDITRLDRIGIPVFAAIRPGAHPQSLCVHAGKGLTAEDACVGAWMEAIEYAVAEPGGSPLEILFATPAEIAAYDPSGSILDFCPLLDASIPYAEPLPAVTAIDLATGRPALVPAERVFLPMPEKRDLPSFFGAGSTGLASGNTIAEAALHGLAEVIERDINSFHLIKDESLLVRSDSYPPQITAAVERIERAGLKISLRFQPNLFDIPCFAAALVDPDVGSPVFVNGGFGCHPIPEVALTRALCEAVQSRLTVIHGGRDDVAEVYRRFDAMTPQERAIEFETRVRRAENADGAMRFEEAPRPRYGTTDIDACLAGLLETLRAAGFWHVLRVVYTHPKDPVQVVRLVVPRMEDFGGGALRVGIRLRNHFLASVGAAA